VQELAERSSVPDYGRFEKTAIAIRLDHRNPELETFIKNFNFIDFRGVRHQAPDSFHDLIGGILEMGFTRLALRNRHRRDQFTDVHFHSGPLQAHHLVQAALCGRKPDRQHRCLRMIAQPGHPGAGITDRRLPDPAFREDTQASPLFEDTHSLHQGFPARLPPEDRDHAIQLHKQGDELFMRDIHSADIFDHPAGEDGHIDHLQRTGMVAYQDHRPLAGEAVHSGNIRFCQNGHQHTAQRPEQSADQNFAGILHGFIHSNQAIYSDKDTISELTKS